MASVLITGGARSGKSTFAVRMAGEAASVVFIATATAGDDDMRERIAAHRSERPTGWVTIEEPIDPLSSIQRVSRQSTIVLDCVTLWVSNLLLADVESGEIVKRVSEFADALDEFAGAIVVTNEVGSGIVPENQLARTYRDALGRANVAIGQRMDRIVLAVAGRMIEATVL